MLQEYYMKRLLGRYMNCCAARTKKGDPTESCHLLRRTQQGTSNADFPVATLLRKRNLHGIIHQDCCEWKWISCGKASKRASRDIWRACVKFRGLMCVSVQLVSKKPCKALPLREVRIRSGSKT